MKCQRFANQFLFFDSKAFNRISTELFEPEYWQQQNAVTGKALGRGITWFVRYEEKHLVLRHYRRGGLIGRFNPDLFAYLGIKLSRPWMEFQLLAKMTTLGLPVPKPVAGRLIRKGLFYQADLIISRIDGARDLVKVMENEIIPQQLWFEIGKVIASFHRAKVYHSDLNAHNIMLDKSSKVWLIDFDKCGFKKGDSWQAGNMARLLRSLEKEKQLNPALQWQASHWPLLMKGYESLSR